MPSNSLPNSTKKPVDILLLNVSNYPLNPVFPYAFVQVSAVARKYGLSSKRIDFHTIPQKRWKKQISDAIDQYRPRMIGITLRQMDSLLEDQYIVEGKKFLPARDTRILIEQIRECSHLPIVIGGFGFSAYAKDLIGYLNPDFGVVGEPDHFFENFEHVIKRERLSEIHNLVHRESGEEKYVFNQRVFYSPLQETEYDDEVAADLLKFYEGKKATREICAPVEILRGCPMRCYFCAEPDVKGFKLNKRNLAVALQDVEFLANKKGIRTFWFVASELNVAGPQLALEIAEGMLDLMRKTKIDDLKWYGYLLPKIADPAVIETLVRSGHVWSWNEVQSLDEKNLKDAKVPYKVDEALQFFKLVSDEHMRRTGEKTQLGFFLGNAFSSPEVVVNTLMVIEKNGLAGKIGHAETVNGTRIIPSRLDRFPKGRITRYPAGDHRISRTSLLRPTFFLPSALGDALGDFVEVMRFFSYVSGTFISHDFLGFRSEGLTPFLRKNISKEKLRRELRKVAGKKTAPLPQDVSQEAWKLYQQLSRTKVPARQSSNRRVPDVIDRIYANRKDSLVLREVSFLIIWTILTADEDTRLEKLSRFLGYRFGVHQDFFGSFNSARKLLLRFPSKRALFLAAKKDEKIGPDSFDFFSLKAVLQINNLNFKPSFRSVLIASPLVTSKESGPGASID